MNSIKIGNECKKLYVLYSPIEILYTKKVFGEYITTRGASDIYCIITENTAIDSYGNVPLSGDQCSVTSYRCGK